jgi:predicted aminopeptidase
MFKKYIILAGTVIVLLTICSCETARYYGQAIRGQYGILEKRRPISEIIADPNSPKSLRQKLAFILTVREFAETELQLPVENNYLTYVELNQPYVVWNVFAAPEFSIRPKTWCYPIVGCAAYRGYFLEEDAQKYASGLNDEGYDVYVAGVTAYSTLGWFDDPVLSTFLNYSRLRSAGLIFHELAHRILYIKGDTVFNESFATAVEQEGIQRWLAESQTSSDFSDYLRSFDRHQEFIDLVLQYRRRLDTLYLSDASDAQKRQEKADLMMKLRHDFDQLKSADNGLSAYENWMKYSLNNAKIASVSAYHDYVPAFRKLLARNGGNLNQFYDACRQLGRTAKDERDRILSRYMEK